MDTFDTLPLCDRAGNVVGHALIDSSDAAFASQWTWRLNVKQGHWPYAERFAGGAAIGLHRVLMGAAPFDGAESDHINGNSLDNRRANLRWVTHAENMQNRRLHRNNTSGHRGVMFDSRKRRWCGQVKRGGRKVWLRYFDNKEAAAVAVAAARRELLPYATS